MEIIPFALSQIEQKLIRINARLATVADCLAQHKILHDQSAALLAEIMQDFEEVYLLLGDEGAEA